MDHINISAAATLRGPYGATVTVEGGRNIKRVRKFIPLNVSEHSGGYVFRMRIQGEGRLILHEAGLEVSART
jgi:hypothetical protein